MEKNNKQTK